MSPSVRNIIAWVLQVLLGLAFMAAGFPKLKNIDESIKTFSGLGLPGWFAYLIGGAEILGGIGLLIPRTMRLAALGLLIIMAGAVYMHAVKIPGGLAKGVPALVLFVLLGVLLWLRRPATSTAA